MFDKPRPSLNVRALIRDMLNDERDLIILLGQDFLSGQLKAAETRLRNWQRYLDNHYAGTTPPRGDAARLRAYQIEHDLIAQLARESQTEPFPIVHQRALNQARQRVQQWARKGDFANASLRTARLEAHLRQELLIALWFKWGDWLKPQRRQQHLSWLFRILHRIRQKSKTR